MTDRGFFDETSEQSRVKSVIVAKYFGAWARVMIATYKRFPYRTGGKIAYIDLFAGPGRFKDGTKSTPLLVLEMALNNEDLRDSLVTLFNDKDQDNSQSLDQAIQELPGIDQLKYRPQIRRYEVGKEIVKMFEQMHLVPTLFFVDPWGYKGLSLELVNSVLKDWGCDCIFFFNYNRINMGLNNLVVREHMDALFGSDRAEKLRGRLASLNPHDRELSIVEEISQALREMGGRYVLPFCFKNSTGSRTNHHLIFVSKNFKGYEIMKEIMAHESSEATQGVPSFEYSPADPRQLLLFQLTRPLDELGERLLKEYQGQTLKMKVIYRGHNVGTRFIKKNYKDVLTQLEFAGKIVAVPSATERHKDTFGDEVEVSFPSTGG